MVCPLYRDSIVFMSTPENSKKVNYQLLDDQV